MSMIRSAVRPVALEVRPEGIPEELKTLPRWVLWAFTQKEKEWTKPPFRVDGSGKASSTTPGTWSTYEEALTIYKKRSGACGGSPADGIGFMFDGSGYFGVDLDDCRDLKTNELKPEALEIVRELSSWVEISPSGRGVHLIGRGTLPPGRRRRSWIEVYNSGRYFTVTGHVLPGASLTILDRSEAIGRFHAKYLGSETAKTKSTAQTTVIDLDDTVLVEKAAGAKNGASFRALWSGDTSGYAGDDSRADLALCSSLAFWTGRDATRMDRLFRASGLYRDKWNREDYRERTIAAAIANAREVYTPRNGDPARVWHRAAHAAAAEGGEAFTVEHLTDLGNALRFVRLRGDGLRFASGWKRWALWNGARWELDPAYEIVRRFDAVLFDLIGVETKLRSKAAGIKIEVESKKGNKDA